MLVGLHTCGDLCSNLLRLFCSSDTIKCMCCVGCCYHHITEAAEGMQWTCTPTHTSLGLNIGDVLESVSFVHVHINIHT